MVANLKEISITMVMAMARKGMEDGMDELGEWISFGVLQIDLVDGDSIWRRMALSLASVPSRLL
jgi:hypothetical protein